MSIQITKNNIFKIILRFVWKRLRILLHFMNCQWDCDLIICKKGKGTMLRSSVIIGEYIPIALTNYNFSWYGQMGMEEETARRIFRYCDQVRAREKTWNNILSCYKWILFQRDRGKITLEDFRRATLKKNAKNYEP